MLVLGDGAYLHFHVILFCSEKRERTEAKFIRKWKKVEKELFFSSSNPHATCEFKCHFFGIDDPVYVLQYRYPCM